MTVTAQSTPKTYKVPNMKVHSMRFYTRSAWHVYGRKFDNTPVECAQVVFHKTLPDGRVESKTNHLVRVAGSKWQVGNTGLFKIYVYIGSATGEYMHTEVIPPPPPPPPKKKRRRRRKRNQKSAKKQVTA